jgi:uncharacterized protein YjbI with pentapeptide repeats
MIGKGSKLNSGTRATVLFTALFALLLFPSGSALFGGQSPNEDASQSFVCNGKYKDGSKPTSSELVEILNRQNQELALNKALRKLRPYTPIDRRKIANLCGADLSNSKLSKTLLSYTHLEGANLEYADLNHADLSRANLTDANLKNANLSSANLSRANLTRANLDDANLSHAILDNANLSHASLSGANLSIATLANADMTGDDLIDADLTRANLTGADLTSAYSSFANLSHADLLAADLTGATFDEADLSNAQLYATKLKGCSLRRANLYGAEFDADLDSFPEAEGMAYATNLSQLSFSVSDAALEKLRSEFKAEGLHDQARQLTYAIRHSELLSVTEDGSTFKHPAWERYGNHYLFEVTSDYGMSPLKVLPTLVYMIETFTVVYLISILVSSNLQNPRSGIWAIWSEDRINKSEGSAHPLLLTQGFPPSRFSETVIGKWCRKLKLSAAMLAFYFSVLSTLRIGWRDFNVGSWLVRIQKREYVLHATGWVRVISGIQSLISVYLIALFLLTYFSTPFDF